MVVGQSMSAALYEETRGDDGPSDHGTLPGLDDGRGRKGGPIIAESRTDGVLIE